MLLVLLLFLAVRWFSLFLVVVVVVVGVVVVPCGSMVFLVFG